MSHGERLRGYGVELLGGETGPRLEDLAEQRHRVVRAHLGVAGGRRGDQLVQGVRHSGHGGRGRRHIRVQVLVEHLGGESPECGLPPVSIS